MTIKEKREIVYDMFSHPDWKYHVAWCMSNKEVTDVFFSGDALAQIIYNRITNSGFSKEKK